MDVLPELVRTYSSVIRAFHTSVRNKYADFNDHRSASFYPQPISNYFRKSTVGLAIDFPTLNVLGFWCYTTSTACFLYSPTIRSQYAYRHPDAPETTVRFNDFLFAAHGAAMCVIIYSQFFPQIWGFTIGRTQRVSRAVLGIFWGLVIGVVIVAFMAKFLGKDGGYDASDWAWIDVVSALQSSWLCLLKDLLWFAFELPCPPEELSVWFRGGGSLLQ